MTYPPDGRCEDCRATGLPNVFAEPGHAYCAAHAYARRAYKKRHQKRAERARDAGLAAPPVEPYEPLPVSQVKGAYFPPSQVRAAREALAAVRLAEDRVRRALDGTDLRAVGSAAQDLLDAGLVLRSALDPLDRAALGSPPSRVSPRRGRARRA